MTDDQQDDRDAQDDVDAGDDTGSGDWQVEIVGDRSAMLDALKDLVPAARIEEAATYVTARLAQPRNGARLLIRAERYEELESAEERLADLVELARAVVAARHNPRGEFVISLEFRDAVERLEAAVKP